LIGRELRGGTKHFHWNERERLKHARELFWHYWLPLLVMLTLIKLESTDALSGAHTAGHLRQLLLWLGVHLPSQQLDLLNLVFRKSGHMVGYALLCLCWLLLLRGTYWLQHDYKRSLQGKVHVRRMWWRTEWAVLAVFCTFVVATADELHQMSIPSRSGSWWDVALDTSAGMIAVALVWAKATWLCRGEQAVVDER
jgi:VanZ family protein